MTAILVRHLSPTSCVHLIELTDDLRLLHEFAIDSLQARLFRALLVTLLTTSCSQRPGALSLEGTQLALLLFSGLGSALRDDPFWLPVVEFIFWLAESESIVRKVRVVIVKKTVLWELVVVCRGPIAVSMSVRERRRDTALTNRQSKV